MYRGGGKCQLKGLCWRLRSHAVCVLPVTERRAVALGDLLHLVVVSQHKERLLKFAHLLHFGHHVLVDSIHDLLHTSGGKNSQLTLLSPYVSFVISAT